MTKRYLDIEAFEQHLLENLDRLADDLSPRLLVAEPEIANMFQMPMRVWTEADGTKRMDVDPLVEKIKQLVDERQNEYVRTFVSCFATLVRESLVDNGDEEENAPWTHPN